MKSNHVFKEYISNNQIADLLEGERVIVFGAYGGIGESICENMIKAGATVIAVGRNETKLYSLKNRIPQISIQLCDVSNNNQIIKFFEQLDAFCLPSIVINCAGIFLDSDKKGKLYKITKTDWDDTFITNFNSNVSILESYDYLLKEKGVQGKYISISSVDGMKSAQSVYGLSKCCLNQFLFEYSRRNSRIEVFAIAPGPTATPMMSPKKNYKYYRTDHPDLRCGIPQDIGNLAVFIASSKNGLKSGSVVRCDGGYIL